MYTAVTPQEMREELNANMEHLQDFIKAQNENPRYR